MSLETFDVVVAGGGAAGVAAAVGARRAGARALLIERGPCLGGAATLRNVLTYCGLYTCGEEPRQVVFGVAEEVLAILRDREAVTPPTRFTGVAVIFDPESVKHALDMVCAQAGVELLLHATVVGAHRDGDRLVSVRVLDHRGMRDVAAAAFVDATGDGDLASFGGAGVRYGTEGRVQVGTLGIRFGGIGADADLSRDTWAEAIRAAKARGVQPLLAERGLVARLPVSGDVIAYLVDEAYDGRDAASLTGAEVHGRQQAQAYLLAVRAMPGCESAYIVSTGPEIGTRESRHVLGRHQLAEAEAVGAVRFADVVALGAWPVEYHGAPGEPARWQAIAEGGAYHIPLRTLQSRDTANLLAAGRLLDGDRGAGASLRVMGTAFATGHAAGVAAAAQANHGQADAAAVRAELNRQNARLPASV